MEPASRTKLLTEQFKIQSTQYREKWPHAWFTIVQVDDTRAGRLYVARQPDCLLVVELSLLPEYRGNGIGSGLIKNIQAESIRTSKPIRLSAVTDSGAYGFYLRLGFKPLSHDPSRTRMEWRAHAPGHT